MPEYLAPGVFVEETSFRAKSIEGVSTTTTGFIGPARFGPVTEEPDIVTSVGEFERVYGDGQKIVFDGNETHNFLWHGVRGFFEEGGKRLYVSRVFRPLAGDYPPADFDSPTKLLAGYTDGHGRGSIAGGGATISVRARFPGAAGNLRVRVGLRAGQNVLGALPDPSRPGQYLATLNNLRDGDIVWIRTGVLTSPPASPPLSALPFFRASLDDSTGDWSFTTLLDSPPSSPPHVFSLDSLVPDPRPGQGDAIRVVTVAVSALSADGKRELGTWTDLPPDPGHRTGGVADSLFSLFGADPASGDTRTLPLVFGVSPDTADGLDVVAALQSVISLSLGDAERSAALAKGKTELQALEDKLTRGILGDLVLDGGNDGKRPGAAEVEGSADPELPYKTGLKQFEDIEDISIVAAPGSTWNYASDDWRDEANQILNLLIAHAESMRYRIAVLDSADGQSIADVRKLRAKLDSKYAAFYYPWVKILDPITRTELNLPPSGFVAGIYARNDIERAVYKAPANEVVRSAIGFEANLNKAQQEVLNPEGINCFRFFEGRGYRLWGARTISSDPEWKYVNLRRYFAYLERSIDKGTQWAVFEPNGEALWANVRRTIEDFLLNEWMSGALLGDKPEKSFFVRCDRSTMSQNDLDNGRLICLIGVAPLRPAEFVIFRVGQWTADRKA